VTKLKIISILRSFLLINRGGFIATKFIAPRDFLTDLTKVFDILSLYNETREWKKALAAHVPLKKGFKLYSGE
jgi:hypothetical protein